MKNPPVHWYEGLFLLPQHLQCMERHWREANTMSQQWDHPFNYGLHSFDFSREALANHQFQVHTLKARMPDGTLVDLEMGEEPDRVSLKEGVQEAVASADVKNAFEKEAVIRVYLGVPKLTMGRENVSKPGAPSDARFTETMMEVDDENRSNKEKDMLFRKLNVRLLLSTQDLAGYELLPVAQIKRASEGEAAPQLDDSYIPPVMSISTWPELGRDIVRAIYDMIGQKMEVLAEQITSRGVARDTRDPGDMDRIHMLERLNEAYCTLGVLAFAEGVHPIQAYTELCRIGGQLSIFGEQRRAIEIPRYDHEDLARIFKYIRREIEKLLYALRDYTFYQRFFIGAGLTMQVSLEPQWFNSDWQWFIGVDKGDLSDRELRELLSPGQLDWKIASARDVERRFTQREPGLTLKPVDRAIRALPARPNWVYYEVAQDANSTPWREIRETETLAMRLKDSLIVNRNQLQGEQKLIVSAHGKAVPLQFALFAVPLEK